MGVLGALLLLVAVLSFTRAVQRVFEQAWELAPLGVRNTLNGVRWAAVLAVFLLVGGWLHTVVTLSSAAGAGQRWCPRQDSNLRHPL